MKTKRRDLYFQAEDFRMADGHVDVPNRESQALGLVRCTGVEWQTTEFDLIVSIRSRLYPL